MLALEMHTKAEPLWNPPNESTTETDARDDLLKKLAAARREVEYLQRTLEKLGAGIDTAIEDTERLELMRPKVATIQLTVCRYYGISKDELLAQRRTAAVVRVRQVAMYLCRELTLRSLPDIGRRFGNMDHTTVLHGSRKVAKQLPLNASLAYEVAELTNILGGCQ